MKQSLLLIVFFGLFACTNTQSVTSTSPTEVMKPQQLLVTLSEEASLKGLATSGFDQLDLATAQLVSRSQKQYIVSLKTYDENIDALVKKMGGFRGVINVKEIEKGKTETTASESAGMSVAEPLKSPRLTITMKDGVDAKTVLASYHTVIVSSIKPISKSENKVTCKLACTKAEVANLITRLEAEPSILKAEMATDTKGNSSGTNSGFSKTSPIGN